MPVKSAKKQKETRLSIRASDPEKSILMEAARARHTNISQFVLQASLDAAHSVLADQSEFRLSADQWKAFCERLDAPAKVIPALKDLFSEPEPVG
ncbi:MAG: DUF1778 domain-containing protein [Acidobacteria bacterium]|nr:DUF1778 domain-containing protein [Acidobacteriota bacterium]